MLQIEARHSDVTIGEKMKLNVKTGFGRVSGDLLVIAMLQYDILTSLQLVILETSWAPWQQRMNPARLRSTHTTDSSTNTLTWRCRRGRGEVEEGREDG